jgi:site-specific DNA-adenine methylase
MLKLFRYSGGKSKLANLYKLPDKSFNRIVEPYLGSGAFSLSYANSKNVLGYEINEDLYDMWCWLKKTTKEELVDLYQFVEDLKKQHEKPDLKQVSLENGPLTYLRVNVCSVMTGQLSSWKIYPQHRLPIQNTIQCLPLLKNFEVVLGSGEEFKNNEDDLVFIDPPYLNTVGNYKSVNNKKLEKNYDAENTIKLIDNLTCPIIFTYGSNAKEVFPQYNWEVVKQMKVPNIRCGGTVDRYEYVSYINF